MTTVDFYRENVKGKFALEKDFPGTTNLILMEKPHEVAEKVKNFLVSLKSSKTARGYPLL